MTNTTSPLVSRTSVTPDGCGICGSDSTLPLFDAADFDGRAQRYVLHRCDNCHVVQTQPRASAQLLSDAYDSNYYGGTTSKFVQLVEYWLGISAKRRARRLLKLHGNGNRKLRVLDFGCGRGVLLGAFAELGHEVLGVEQSGSPFEGEPHVHCGNIDQLNLVPGAFDIIVLWHVLEHLENPCNTVMKLAQLLGDSGSLFLSVPNIGSYQAQVFEGVWFHLDLPRHVYHFDSESLEYLLAGRGFEIRDQTTFSIDQNMFGFIQSTLNVIPGLKNNQFYGLLKSGMSAKVLLGLLLYLPLVTIISFVAFIELLVSAVQGRGATLTVRAVKKSR